MFWTPARVRAAVEAVQLVHSSLWPSGNVSGDNVYILCKYKMEDRTDDRLLGRPSLRSRDEVEADKLTEALLSVTYCRLGVDLSE